MLNLTLKCFKRLCSFQVDSQSPLHDPFTLSQRLNTAWPSDRHGRFNWSDFIFHLVSLHMNSWRKSWLIFGVAVSFITCNLSPLHNHFTGISFFCTRTWKERLQCTFMYFSCNMVFFFFTLYFSLFWSSDSTHFKSLTCRTWVVFGHQGVDGSMQRKPRRRSHRPPTVLPALKEEAQVSMGVLIWGSKLPRAVWILNIMSPTFMFKVLTFIIPPC